jgi:hypothetical protein
MELGYSGRVCLVEKKAPFNAVLEHRFLSHQMILPEVETCSFLS